LFFDQGSTRAYAQILFLFNSFLKNIEIGELKVLTPTHVYTFPPSETVNKRPELKAELRVITDTFWVRLCTMGDLGFAEAYMYGEVACDDLISLFQVNSFRVIAQSGARLKHHIRSFSPIRKGLPV